MTETYIIFKDTRNESGFGRSKGSVWEVSNFGNVKKNGVSYNCFVDDNGYARIGTGNLLHRIVVETFIGKIPKNCEVDHIDGNKLNNSINNLRIVTHSENMLNPVTNIVLHKTHKKLSNDTKHKMSKRCTSCRWVSDGNNTKFVTAESVDYYIKNGWHLGRK